jgi:hypothetical protein
MYIGHDSECPECVSQKFWLNDWENIESRLNNGWQMCLIVFVIQNHVVHKAKQCIPSSNVERLGKEMIRESLNQERPILWII